MKTNKVLIEADVPENYVVTSTWGLVRALLTSGGFDARIIEPAQPAAVPDGYALVPIDVYQALRMWSGYEPSQSVLGRAVTEWLEAAPVAQPNNFGLAENVGLITPQEPAQQAGVPDAWIRFCSDGCIEGPLRNIDEARLKSGAWTPLYAAPPAAPAAQDDKQRISVIDELVVSGTREEIKNGVKKIDAASVKCILSALDSSGVLND